MRALLVLVSLLALLCVGSTVVQAQAQADSQFELDHALIEVQHYVDGPLESALLESHTEVDAAMQAEASAAAAMQAEAELNDELDNEAEADAEADAELDAEAEFELQLETEGDHALDAEQEAEDFSYDEQAHSLLEAATDSMAALSAEQQAEVEGTVNSMLDSMLNGNGCGSGWTARVVPDWNMHQACEVHDACYDNCKRNKADCDAQFLKNMMRICDTKFKGGGLKSVTLSLCHGQAKLYHKSVVSLGNKAWQKAQLASGCVAAKVMQTAAVVATQKIQQASGASSNSQPKKK